MISMNLSDVRAKDAIRERIAADIERFQRKPEQVPPTKRSKTHHAKLMLPGSLRHEGKKKCPTT